MAIFELNSNTAKKLTDSYRDRIKKAEIATVNRFVFHEKSKHLPIVMPKYLENPTPQTLKSTRVLRAPKNGPAEAYIYFAEFSSAYLNPNIVGESNNELYGQKPVIKWNIAAFRNSKVRGKLKIKLNKFGNIPSLRRADKISAIRNHPDTFELETQQGGKEPGVYLRLNESEVFTIWTYEPTQQRKAIFPFPKLVDDEYNKMFPVFWKKSIKEAFA